MEAKSVRIYLDEDVRPLLTRVLKKRGYDVISACEMGITGLTDEKQIFWLSSFDEEIDQKGGK